MPQQLRLKLASWMKEKGFSDTQLATASGYSVDTVRRAKSGRKISPGAAVAICRALDVELDQISDLNY